MSIGDVVLVKITGEPVYILDTQAGVHHVRRAVQGETGVRYETEGFLPGELATHTAYAQEELNRQAEFYELRKKADALKLAIDAKLTPKAKQVAEPVDEQPNLFN